MRPVPERIRLDRISLELEPDAFIVVKRCGRLHQADGVETLMKHSSLEDLAIAVWIPATMRSRRSATLFRGSATLPSASVTSTTDRATVPRRGLARSGVIVIRELRQGRGCQAMSSPNIQEIHIMAMAVAFDGPGRRRAVQVCRDGGWRCSRGHRRCRPRRHALGVLVFQRPLQAPVRCDSPTSSPAIALFTAVFVKSSAVSGGLDRDRMSHAS